jgi:hypothetical protein
MIQSIRERERERESLKEEQIELSRIRRKNLDLTMILRPKMGILVVSLKRLKKNEQEFLATLYSLEAR